MLYVSLQRDFFPHSNMDWMLNFFSLFVLPNVINSQFFWTFTVSSGWEVMAKFAPKYIFFKAKVWEKTRKEVSPELRKRTSGILCLQTCTFLCPICQPNITRKCVNCNCYKYTTNNCESNLVLFPQAITGKICTKTWVSLHLQWIISRFFKVFDIFLICINQIQLFRTKSLRLLI